MSLKPIVIQQSGEDENIVVDGVRVNKSGTGYENWVFVASGGYTMIKMAVGKNGDYLASQYGAWAIREVNVTQKINGVQTTASDAQVITKPRSIALKVGGITRLMQGVKRIRVNLQDGGTIDLIPQSDVDTMYLMITKRGKYRAIDQGHVGYNNVTVNVQESASGYDGRIDTGDIYDDADVYDGDGGWTDLPHEIRVIQPPNKTTYTSGETVDYTGMIVKAYIEDGTVWTSADYPDGIIPDNAITLPIYAQDAWITPIYPNGQFQPHTNLVLLWLYNEIMSGKMDMIKLSQYNRMYFHGENNDHSLNNWGITSDTTVNSTSDIYCIKVRDRIGDYYCVWASKEPFTVTRKRINNHPYQTDELEYFDDAHLFYENINYKVYWWFELYNLSTLQQYDIFESNFDIQNDVTRTSDNDFLSFPEVIAMNALYGDAHIPVLWKRPRDNKELSSTFDIMIDR